MRKYKIIVKDEVDDYFIELMRFVASQQTKSFAVRYVKGIRKELEELSLFADMLPKSRYLLPLRYHKDAKITTIGNHKLAVIFHMEGDYVIVDKILPSMMITY